MLCMTMGKVVLEMFDSDEYAKSHHFLYYEMKEWFNVEYVM